MRVSRASNKISFAIKLFQFCDWKTQQRYILQEGVNISERKLISLVDSLCDFLINFNHANKCIQIPLPKPKSEIRSTKSKDILFLHYYNDIIEHSARQVCSWFRFENNNSCVFSIEKFGLHGNQFFLTEIFTLNYCKIHHLYRNRYYIAEKFEVIGQNYDV